MKSASLVTAYAAVLASLSMASVASAQQASPDQQPTPPPPATSSASVTTTTTVTSPPTTTAPATTESPTTTAPPPASAPAEPAKAAPTFGQAGELVFEYSHFWGWGGSDAAPGTLTGSHIYNGAFLDIHNTSLSNSGGSTFQFTIQPSADYFVIDNLSVGGFIGFAYVKFPNSTDPVTGDTIGSHATAFQVGPRVGYNIPLGTPLFSLWPKVGYSFQTLKITSGGKSGDSINTSELDVSIPIMFHPATHFFIGFGPAIAMQLNNNALNADGTDSSVHHRAFSIGGQVSLGGWLGPL